MNKEFENYSKKLGKLGGEAYKNMISYNISKKFYLEDIKSSFEKKSRHINTNKSLDINKLKDEIILKLLPSNKVIEKENIKRGKTIAGFLDKLNQFYSYKPHFGKIYKSVEKIDSKNSITKIPLINFSDSENKKMNLNKPESSFKKIKSDSNSEANTLSSNSNIRIKSCSENKGKNIKKKYKNIKELESNLFLKNVKGSKLKEYINEMKNNDRLFIYDKISQIKKDSYYNVCCEITVNTKDIINIKIQQIFKNIEYIKFLYEVYKYLKNERTKKRNVASEVSQFFGKETNFINFINETVFITLSSGNIDSFKELKNELKIGNGLSSKSVDIFDNLKEKYNLYMIYYPNHYPNYGDKEIYNLHKRLDKQEEKIDSLTKLVKELQNQINNIQEKKEEMKKDEIKVNNIVKESNKIIIKETINKYKEGKEKEEDEEEWEEEEEEEEEEEDEEEGDIEISNKK